MHNEPTEMHVNPTRNWVCTSPATTRRSEHRSRLTKPTHRGLDGREVLWRVSARPRVGLQGRAELGERELLDLADALLAQPQAAADLLVGGGDGLVQPVVLTQHGA